MRFSPCTAAILLLLSGCAFHNAAPTTTVTFDYDARTGASARKTALLTARDQCKARGYKDAAETGMPKLSCLQAGQGSCARTSATEAYRCIGLST